MGGIVCAIPRNAILRFKAVPTRPLQVKQFDAQMRQLYANPIIAEAVGENHDRAREVCAILSKDDWSRADRERLFEGVEYLYELEPASG